MKVSPHLHAESFLTGSTIGTLVAKAKELGRTHIAYTDHGTLSSALKVYGQAKKAGLKFIPGIEIYFKDGTCDIVSASKANRCKYFTTTLYCQDQEAFQALSRMVSREDFPTIYIREEKQQLWSWKNLEEIAKYNVNIVLGGVHCMVGKAMLAGDAKAGMSVFEKLHSIFGNRLYSALICEPWDKKWANVVEVRYTDGTRDALFTTDVVATDKARRVKALELVENKKHYIIKSKSVGMMYSDVNKTIDKVVLHKGFLPVPGGDASLKVNKFLNALASKAGLKVLATDYAYYADKADKIVQTMKLEGNDKLYQNLHMKTTEEILDYLTNVMKMVPAAAMQVLNNNDEWASLFNNLSLKYDWRLATIDGDPLKLAMEIIKNGGRMKMEPAWIDRLKYEIQVIAKNPVKDLTAYFLPIRDVLNHYKENGKLVGPGRGSAGGSLFCYLLGITEIDPFEYDLPFNRFFSLERIMMRKLPDIDVDLESRELLVGEDGHSGYLYGRWGDKAAQISTRHTLRLKSTIKDTNRYFNGKVQEEIEIFTKGLPDPPQGIKDQDFVFGFEDEDTGAHVPGLIEISENLKEYATKRPEEWDIVVKAMGLTRAHSRHASAFVLSDVAIKDTVPTKDGNITQYEAKECESAGLIKYDFLVINQLKDIRICLDLINKRNQATKVGQNGPNSEIQTNKVGYFEHKGKTEYIWKLPQDPDAYKSVWAGQTETIFQINTRSMVPVVKEILPRKIMDLANILALVRPGPMDFIDPNTGRNMVEEYILRSQGKSKPDIQIMYDIIPESYGILIYQEDLGKIAKQLAGFTPEAAEILRENMAKKRMTELMKIRPEFIEGAIKKVSKEIAETIWDRMVTFGRYGFSIIHAVEYAHITYACIFLKHHYPLEWWAAVLTNADEKEITGKFWPYVKDVVLSPDINLSSDIMAVDYENKKIRSKLGIIRGMGDKTLEPIVTNRPYKDIQDFVNKEVAGRSLAHKLIHVGVLDSLFPAGSNLRQKLKAYEDAMEIKEYKAKAAKAQETGKKMRQTQPKEGEVPPGYVDLKPLEDAAMKKRTLPTLPINLYSLALRHSKHLSKGKVGYVEYNEGYPTVLVSGEALQKFDQIPGDEVHKNTYFSATAFVIESKEFSYGKAVKKKALKLIIDADGYVSEKVLWPDYNSGELIYPKSLKKGSIATFFFTKRAGKKDISINKIALETENT